MMENSLKLGFFVDVKQHEQYGHDIHTRHRYKCEASCFQGNKKASREISEQPQNLDIFEEEMRKFDRRMKTECIIDNCSAHLHLELDHTEFFYFRNTLHIPPIDSGIIKKFTI